MKVDRHLLETAVNVTIETKKSPEKILEISNALRDNEKIDRVLEIGAKFSQVVPKAAVGGVFQGGFEIGFEYANLLREHETVNTTSGS